MTARTADPGRTHAVLVGIEKYEAGGEWNRLSGPVRDVLAFYDWLRSRNVPADQITTLVSPSDENVALVDQSKLHTAPATSAAVRGAFNLLHEKRGDLLFLFWAGHGVVHEEEHRLFLADATTSDKRNLDLDALQQSLRSSYFPGFRQQIIIVDACANYQRFGFTFPSEELPCGDPLGHEQFVFFAARPGEVAKNLGEEKRGLFSRVLLKQARSLEGSDWPPDMRALAEKVQEEFAALRESGDASQMPVYEWSRDWDGNVGKFLAAGPLLNGMAGAAAQAGRFGPEPRAIATAALPISQSALSIWRQKLEFMLVEDALCVDPAMKFRLKHLITEAQEKIHLLGG